MSEDTGKKRFIKDFLNHVQHGAGFIEGIRIERTVRLPGSDGEGSTAKSLSGRPISNITDLLEDDLRHTFDDGYFTFRFVAALVGSGKTSLLKYLHELAKNKATYYDHSIVVEFQLDEIPKGNDFIGKFYCHILAYTFYELLHNSNILAKVREVSERILGEFIDSAQVAQLKAIKNLMPFRNKFKNFIANNIDSFEEFLFYIIAEISKIDPKFTFVYLIDELDALATFDYEIQETKLLFKELIRRGFQVFRSKIQLFIYLVGTSGNVGSFIASDSVIESLIGDSIINLNKGFNNEFAEIRAKIDDRIKGAYKGYKNFDQAWQEIENIKIKTAITLREFCQEYGSAVLAIHSKYFEEAPEQAFEGDARKLVESKCRQAWASYLQYKAYELVVSSTNEQIAGHSFDCYVELKHNGKPVARAFGEAKNYELLSSHLDTFKQWLDDVKFEPYKPNNDPKDLAFIIAPSCPSLLQQKLKLQNIEYIEAPKVINPTLNKQIWKRRHTINGHSSLVYGIAITTDSKTLITHSSGKIILWDMSNFKQFFSSKGHASTIYDLAISSNSRILATASKDQQVKIWSLPTCNLIYFLKKYADPIYSVAFSPDGSILASGGSKKYKDFGNNVGIYLWDVNTGKLIHTLGAHSLRVNSLAFSPDGKLLFSGSNDGTVKIWNVENRTLKRILYQHPEIINCVAITPDGKNLISSGGDGIKIWDLATGNLKNSLENKNFVRYFALSPDGKILAYDSDKAIKIWDLETKKLIQTLDTDGLEPTKLAFSPDGKTLVVGHTCDPVTIWKLS